MLTNERQLEEIVKAMAIVDSTHRDAAAAAAEKTIDADQEYVSALGVVLRDALNVLGTSTLDKKDNYSSDVIIKLVTPRTLDITIILSLVWGSRYQHRSLATCTPFIIELI